MSSAGECAAPGTSSNALVASMLESYGPSFFVATTMISVVLLAFLVVEKYNLLYHGKLWMEYLTTTVPTIEVTMTEAGFPGRPRTRPPS